jgi:ribosomal protein L31
VKQTILALTSVHLSIQIIHHPFFTGATKKLEANLVSANLTAAENKKTTGLDAMLAKE